jgi:hypothetical protein
MNNWNGGFESNELRITRPKFSSMRDHDYDLLKTNATPNYDSSQIMI